MYIMYVCVTIDVYNIDVYDVKLYIYVQSSTHNHILESGLVQCLVAFTQSVKSTVYMMRISQNGGPKNVG